MDLQEKYDRLDMNYDNLKEELEKVKKDYINSERAADACIEKLIEERNYWEGKYRELDKLVMQKFGVKLD